MRIRSRSIEGAVLVALAAVLVLAVAPAARGAAYRFKVDLTVFQESDWNLRFGYPRDCQQGHYEYKGDGSGYLSVKVRGARVTFRGTRLLQSSEIRARGFAVNDGQWQGPTPFGRPEECVTSPAKPMDTHSCNPLVKRPGTARSFLLVVGGRLRLLGGFYRDDRSFACPDPTYYTGPIHGGGPPRRADVDDLIRNKRVRSIELSASGTQPFGVRDFEDPGGANTYAIAGSGIGKARWHVKLTRIR